MDGASSEAEVKEEEAMLGGSIGGAVGRAAGYSLSTKLSLNCWHDTRGGQVIRLSSQQHEREGGVLATHHGRSALCPSCAHGVHGAGQAALRPRHVLRHLPPWPPSTTPPSSFPHIPIGFTQLPAEHACSGALNKPTTSALNRCSSGPRPLLRPPCGFWLLLPGAPRPTGSALLGPTPLRGVRQGDEDGDSTAATSTHEDRGGGAVRERGEAGGGWEWN